MIAIAEQFGLDSPVMPNSVHEADSRILLDERAALMGAPAGRWANEDLNPLGIEIPAWSPSTAEQCYLDRFVDLSRRNREGDTA